MNKLSRELACPQSSGLVHPAAAAMADISSTESDPVSRSRQKAGSAHLMALCSAKLGRYTCLPARPAKAAGAAAMQRQSCLTGQLSASVCAPMRAADAVQALALAAEGVDGCPTPLSITAKPTAPGLEGKKLGIVPHGRTSNTTGRCAVILRYTFKIHQHVLTLWSAAAAVKGGGPCSTLMH